MFSYFNREKERAGTLNQARNWIDILGLDYPRLSSSPASSEASDARQHRQELTRKLTQQQPMNLSGSPALTSAWSSSVASGGGGFLHCTSTNPSGTESAAHRERQRLLGRMRTVGTDKLSPSWPSAPTNAASTRHTAMGDCAQDVVIQMKQVCSRYSYRWCSRMFVTGCTCFRFRSLKKKSGDADAVGWRLAYTTLQDSLFVPRLL